MKGGNRPRIAQTKLVEVPNLVHLRGVVHLVNGNENRLLGPAKRTGHLFVVSVDAGTAIDDQYDGVRLVGSGECLMGNGRLEVIVIAHFDAARVDQGETKAVPDGFMIRTIARDTAHLVNDSIVDLGDTVNEC